MTSMPEELDVKIDSALRTAKLSDFVASPVRIEEFGGQTSVELIMSDAAHIKAAKIAVDEVVGAADIYVTVRSVWRIHEVGDPQIAYGPNGSPRAAVLVPVTVRSGESEEQVTVAITKLAEMGFEQILGVKPDLRQVATLVIEGALKSGGSSYWNPEERDYFEVASNAVADLSRSLRKIA